MENRAVEPDLAMRGRNRIRKITRPVNFQHLANRMGVRSIEITVTHPERRFVSKITRISLQRE